MRLFDVSLRDGIQVSKKLPLFNKLKALDYLISAGHKNLEITSFSKLPQFSDDHKFIDMIPDRGQHINFYGLIVSNSGYDKFRLQTRLNGISLTSSVSNKFALANVNKSAFNLLEETKHILRRSRDELSWTKNRVYISHAFATSEKDTRFEGDSIINVNRIIDQLLDNGCQEIVISDTDSLANHVLVEKFCETLIDQYPKHIDKFTFHFHGTKENTVKNVITAMKMGFKSFDVSVVDGWCPKSLMKNGNTNTLELYKNISIDKDLSFENLVNAKNALIYETLHVKNYNSWSFHQSSYLTHDEDNNK